MVLWLLKNCPNYWSVKLWNILLIPQILAPDSTQLPIFIATADTRYLPLYAFGDRVRHCFYLLAQMRAFQNAVHSIEEIDSTFHRRPQESVLDFLLRNYARNRDSPIVSETIYPK